MRHETRGQRLSYFQALVLGAIQGLTEFLPVSSSGHLVLGGVVLGLESPHFLFDIVVHVATLLVTVVYYRRDIGHILTEGIGGIKGCLRGGGVAALVSNAEARMFWLIGVATLPTALIGLVFKNPLQALFGQPMVVLGMLCVTATLLLLTIKFGSGIRTGIDLKVRDALILGIAQGLAIIPGISRSGTTIGVAMFLGVERELAARFSFLMALPAIIGALILELQHPQVQTIDPWALGLGFVSSALVGFGALALLIPIVKGGRFYLFSAYLYPIAVIGWFFL